MVKTRFFFPRQIVSYLSTQIPFWLTFLENNKTELANKCFMMFHPGFSSWNLNILEHTRFQFFWTNCHHWVWVLNFCFHFPKHSFTESIKQVNHFIFYRPMLHPKRSKWINSIFYDLDVIYIIYHVDRLYLNISS